MSWGISTVYAGHAARPEQPLLGSGMEMISAGVVLTVVGVLAGEPRRIDAHALVSQSILAFAYLVLFGSLIAYSCYEWLREHAPHQIVATYAFVNPLVAVLLGWWLLGEQLNMRIIIATTVIGVSLIITPQRSWS
jgi:drug/metabolite transporter (DMT)-like permease